MKRQTFLTIAAAVSVLFAAFMIASPAKMMEGMGSQPNATTNVVLQAMSIILLSIGIITFLARKDAGSIALQAIIIGSIVMHIVLLPIDWVAYQQGTFTQASGIIPGTVIHIIFAIGFIYYLKNLSTK
jgi:hypothetical protein